MNGLEITINDVTKQASLENGIVSFHIDCIKSINRNEMYLKFIGLNLETSENVEWLNIPLNKGDKVIVQIKDVEGNSEPNKVEIKKPKDSIIAGKLRTFKMLKKELEEAGLI
jgi:hypothetical protein